ncbi:MAG: hypothetical protein IJ111_00675 [Eggerthellaceae bacterium]|nr:hypothetical protein [Eggerthellaceae bacterium]
MTAEDMQYYSVEDDPLHQKVEEFKASLQKVTPEMDVSLLLRVLDVVNESSEVKYAFDAIDEQGWKTGTEEIAVGGARVTDDGKLCLTLKSEKHGIEAGKLYSQARKLNKKGCADSASIVVMRKGEEMQVTDIFSHSMVRQMWAGLPFDVVMVTKVDHKPEAE